MAADQEVDDVGCREHGQEVVPREALVFEITPRFSPQRRGISAELNHVVIRTARPFDVIIYLLA